MCEFQFYRYACNTHCRTPDTYTTHTLSRTHTHILSFYDDDFLECFELPQKNCPMRTGKRTTPLEGHLDTHTYKHKYTHIYTQTYTQIYTRIHTHKYTQSHSCTQPQAYYTFSLCVCAHLLTLLSRSCVGRKTRTPPTTCLHTSRMFKPKRCRFSAPFSLHTYIYIYT